MKTIYDIGANNGDDVPYYLKKADRVVCVEANPLLCEQISARFSDYVSSGRLIVANCVASASSSAVGEVPFYVHKTNHVLSQFPRPERNLDDFKVIWVTSLAISDLIVSYGVPYYVKIDIEKHDQVVLNALFVAGYRPNYVSAESHSFEVFLSLISRGGYRYFKLVDGRTVAEKYQNTQITTMEGVEEYSFPFHSAGPFGEDIAGDWIGVDSLFHELLKEGLGWKDIHAWDPRQKSAARLGSARGLILRWFYRLRWRVHLYLEDKDHN